MYEPTKRDHNYIVYHFEMGSIEGTYSNVAFGNDENSPGTTAGDSKCETSPRVTYSMKDERISQCKNGQYTYETVDRNTVLGIDKWEGKKTYGDKLSTSEGQRQGRQQSGDMYVSLMNEKDYLRKKKSCQKNGREKDESGPETEPTTNMQDTLSFQCRKSIQLIVLLQVLVFLMAAASLALVILIIDGTIVCSAVAEGEASKHEKQTACSNNAKEIQTEIFKLKEELNNTRRELRQQKEEGDSKIEDQKREILEMKRFTQVGMAKNNVTTKVSNCTGKADKVHFELRLNSSQQLMLKMFSDIWGTLNNTNTELLEETRSFQAKGNLTQGHIQEVSDSLTKLKAKVLMEEKRLNETMQSQERHSNDVENLRLLINTTRMEIVNKLVYMWKSVNSTWEDQQGNDEASRMWLKINSTKADLEKQIKNISKLVGPIGPPGFNGSQGPAGHRGSPGPKGAGDFSACQYKVKNGTIGGGDSDASVDEPSGSIVIAATCSTNYAKEYNLVVKAVPPRRFICNCRGDRAVFTSGGGSKFCFLHYWLCPKT